MKIKKLTVILSIFLMLVGVGIITQLGFSTGILPAWNPSSVLSVEDTDHMVGKAINIIDEKGNVVSQACRGVTIGDEIINSKGQHYRVVKVAKDTATVKSLGLDKNLLAWQEYLTDERLALAAANRKNGTVGVYHTHSAESYVPTDGSESVPFKGGIYDVGQTFVKRLEEKSGSQILYDRTPHDPHDNAAYQRSRRTAMKLMQQNPIALIDVHRDGIPDPNFYRANISDTDVSQLRLVVGRQNPNMEANLDFARKMMAYANEVHPDIIKEIFMAKGNYNQDLMPTALLIEAGTHTNTKGQAERGVALFADAVPTVLGIEGGPAAGRTGQAPGPGITGGEGGGWRAVGWILGLTLLVGGGFLLISTGSLKGASDRLSNIGREFTNYLGPIRNRVARKPAVKKEQSKKNMADRTVIERRNDVTED